MRFLTSRAPDFLEIICVSYKRPIKLHCFLLSLACQTSNNFKVRVIHDGPDVETRKVIAMLNREYPHLNLSYEETSKRYNDYGHTLRDMGLKTSESKNILLTNDDNYYVPIFIEEISMEIIDKKADIVFFDMVHSHKINELPNPIGYQTLITEPRLNRIDMGSFVFNGKIGREVGFNDRSFAADGMFFEELLSKTDKISKISKVLFVHN
jgi:hypothetical protein